MPLGKKFEIEPLSEQRWSRVERELFKRVALEGVGPRSGAHPKPEPRAALQWRVAVALMLAGAVAAIGGAAGWSAIHRHDASADAPVTPSRVVTGEDGSRLTVGESILEVGPRSVVAVTGDDARGVSVVVEAGRVECEVTARGNRPPFLVLAGDVAVRVVGTHFSVARLAAGVTVHVDRGVVEVTRGVERVELHAGETWPAEAASRIATAPPSAPAPPPTAPQPDVAPTASAKPAPSSSTAPPPSTTATSRPNDARETYRTASSLEASRPDQALAMYRELAAKGGPWGMNALFAAGRLEADRGHRSEARRLLSEYLARYASGPNANDARRLLDRMQ